jgi:hypothetical protein
MRIEGELAALSTTADKPAGTMAGEMHTLSLKDSLIEISEMESLTPILAVTHIATSPHELRAIETSQLVKFAEQLIPLKHGSGKQQQRSKSSQSPRDHFKLVLQLHCSNCAPDACVGAFGRHGP